MAAGGFGALVGLYGADVAKGLIRRHWKKAAGTAFIAGLVSAPFHGVATEPDNIYPEPTLYAVAPPPPMMGTSATVSFSTSGATFHFLDSETMVIRRLGKWMT